MTALDLRLLADTTKERQRATCKMEKLDLVGLLWAEGSNPTIPIAQPESRTSRHVVARVPSPEPAVIEPEVFDAETQPALYVITTPPELRARWEAWRWVRRELAVCLAITAALIAFIYGV